MQKIGKINIQYKDIKLTRMIRKLESSPIKSIKKTRNLLKYKLRAVTLNKLKMDNVLFDFTEDRYSIRSTYEELTENDQAIFSYKKDVISTAANTCFSYMLYCREMNLGVAVHVQASNCYHPEFHRDMLLYGYANIKKLAGRKKISAFICGGSMTDLLPDTTNEEIISMKLLNRDILSLTLPELFGRNVHIEQLNIGGDFASQDLFLNTGKYIIRSEKELIDTQY